MALELVYETHAITTDNEAGIATGWIPGELSERGRRTAAELGRRRRNDGIAAVYVSDLHRAMETAGIAFEGSEMPIIPDLRLRECNYGLLNGMPTTQLERQRSLHIDDPWPGGESYREVVVRTSLLLHDVSAGWDGYRVLWISHSANKWALDHLLLGRDLSEVVAAGFAWQEGWEYRVPTQWRQSSPSFIDPTGTTN
jgi:broad specificity phosphatase PhoE